MSDSVTVSVTLKEAEKQKVHQHGISAASNQYNVTPWTDN